jgi:non-ribosomal peptide synthetase component F
MVTVHHIVIDGWSMRIVCREINTLYAAYFEGRTSPLGEPEIQFGDYCAWEHAQSRSPDLERQLKEWADSLDGIPDAFPLQTDGVCADRPDADMAVRFTLPSDLVREAGILGQRSGATLFMTLLTTYVTLLHRYSGEEDWVVEVPAASRSTLQLEDVVGFLANSLPVRIRLHGNPTFREALARTRDATLYAFSKQDVPWIALNEEMTRRGGRLPSKTLFGLLGFPLDQWSFPGVSCRVDHAFLGALPPNVSLAFYFAERPGEELTCGVRFPRGLFEKATVERLCARYVRLLSTVVQNPDRPIGAYPLIDRAERRSFLTGATAIAAYDRDTTVSQQFLEQVERTPDALALSMDDRKLTYRNLAEWTGRIGAELQRHGAAPGVRVGVCVDRSPELPAALLAVWRAEACYVPLDPLLPLERLAFIIDDAKINLLVTQPHLERRFPGYSGHVVHTSAFQPEVS